jgi:translation elongation factor EF-Ts
MKKTNIDEQLRKENNLTEKELKDRMNKLIEDLQFFEVQYRKSITKRVGEILSDSRREHFTALGRKSPVSQITEKIF